MHALFALILLVPADASPGKSAAPTPKLEFLFDKVAPLDKDTPGRSKDATRAVVLIHGLALHPIKGELATRAELRHWQKSDSALVKELATHSDVYALAYTQTIAVEKVHESKEIVERIRKLKKDGYKEIVLVGHSAGGLIARHLVEDHPDLGVTKVVQVCAPNAGSPLAGLRAVARETQAIFLNSLSRTTRALVLHNRKDKTLPEKVEFACIIGSLRLGGDGVVSCSSQWSEDLQKQGVPAHSLRVTHWDAMKNAKGIESISKLVREAQPRWKAEQVTEAKKNLLGG